MNTKAICLSLFLAFLSGTASAKDFHMNWSGWSRSSSDADSNGDMEGGGVSHLLGTGSLGKAQSGGSFDNLPWDGSSFCAYNDSGQPEGVLLYNAAGTEISRASNGDLLYRTLASSPPSTLCFNFVTSTANAEIYYQIIGGTGRFQNATGESVAKLVIDIKQGINGAQGTETGKIYLSRPQSQD